MVFLTGNCSLFFPQYTQGTCPHLKSFCACTDCRFLSNPSSSKSIRLRMVANSVPSTKFGSTSKVGLPFKQTRYGFNRPKLIFLIPLKFKSHDFMNPINDTTKSLQDCTSLAFGKRNKFRLLLFLTSRSAPSIHSNCTCSINGLELDNRLQ